VAVGAAGTGVAESHITILARFEDVDVGEIIILSSLTTSTEWVR
jgi:hypothetical protein